MGVCVNLLALFAVLLAHFDDGRCIFCKCQVIATFGNQGFGRFSGFVRAIPLVNPFDVNFRLGIGRFNPQGKGIDMSDDFWNWKRTDIADLIGFGQGPAISPLR
jgi:hypothetical protein